MPKLVVNPNSPLRREVPLSRSETLTIGRDPTNDVVLPDVMVSRRHAVVEHRAGRYCLRDMSSANGSVVNGERVSEWTLHDGDVVAIGTARLVFRADAADVPGGKILPHPSAVLPRCAACGGEYRRGDVFCKSCGARVVPSAPPRIACVACGASMPLPARYCAACGQPLSASALAASPGDPPEGALGGAPRSQGSMAIAAEQRPSAPRAEGAPGVLLAASPFAVPAPAEPGSRLAAALVDLVFVLAGQALVLAPVGWYWWARELPRTAAEVPFLPVLGSVVAGALALLLGFLYHVYYWVTRGATPGKELLLLQVQSEDGARLGWPRALLRAVGYLLGVASCGVGFATIVFGGAGLHDRIAGTRVVRGRER